MNQPEEHWAKKNECTSPLGVRFLCWLCRTFGRLPFWAATFWVVLWFWAANKHCRTSSRKYLNAAFEAGLLRDKPSCWSTFRHTFRFADTILDKFLSLQGSEDAPELTIENEDAILSAIAPGRGAVVLCSHLGCTEALMHHGSSWAERRIIALVHTANSRQFNEMIRRQASLRNITFQEVESLRTPASIYALEEAVDSGALLFIAADRVPVHEDSRALTELSFLGKPAWFPSGGVMLANILHAPLVTMTCWRVDGADWRRPNRPSRYRVRFRQLSACVALPRKSRTEAAAALLQGYVDELEHALAESPLDWFNFYDFWQRPYGRKNEQASNAPQTNAASSRRNSS